MKTIKSIHSILGIIPFIWFLSFLLILIIGIAHFGYIPEEGNIVDPTALGLYWLNVFCVLFGIAAYLAFYSWILMSIILIIFFRKKYTFNKTVTFLFIISVLGFFVFRYGFPEVFGWVLD